MNDGFSFFRALFLGEIHEDCVFPYPELSDAEAATVDTLVSTARTFLDEHYDPRAAEAAGWVGDDVLAGLGERGLLGLYVNEAYGGQGLSPLAYCRVFEEIARIDDTLAVVLGVHQSIGMRGLYRFGTDAQKDRFLADLAVGCKLAGLALTEPEAGSDLRNVQTTAVRQDDGSFVLNGEKRWIGNGSKDLLTVLARTDEDDFLLLLVEQGMDGFEPGPSYDTLGLKANDLRPLYFRDVRVPAENVLGDVGAGYELATAILNDGRISLAAGCVGGARHLLDLALDHLHERYQFDQPLADFELVQMKIGDLVTDLYALEAMTVVTAGLSDHPDVDAALEGAAIKVAGSEFLWHAVNRVFQFVGGAAYMEDRPYAKLLRDARIFPIFEGANDVLRVYVALSGLQELGDTLEELEDLSLQEPIQSLGTLADYAGDRLRLEVRPDRLSRVAEPFEDAAEPVADQVKRLRTTSERLLRAHGRDIIQREGQLARLCEAVTNVYAQIAVLSRVTAAYERGPLSDAERLIARQSLARAARRADEALDGVETNDDARLTEIARHVYEQDGYRAVL